MRIVSNFVVRDEYVMGVECLNNFDMVKVREFCKYNEYVNVEKMSNDDRKFIVWVFNNVIDNVGVYNFVGEELLYKVFESKYSKYNEKVDSDFCIGDKYRSFYNRYKGGKSNLKVIKKMLVVIIEKLLIDVDKVIIKVEDIEEERVEMLENLMVDMEDMEIEIERLEDFMVVMEDMENSKVVVEVKYSLSDDSKDIFVGGLSEECMGEIRNNFDSVEVVKYKGLYDVYMYVSNEDVYDILFDVSIIVGVRNIKEIKKFCNVRDYFKKVKMDKREKDKEEILEVMKNIEEGEGIELGSIEGFIKLKELCESRNKKELINRGLRGKDFSIERLDNICYEYVNGVNLLKGYMDIEVNENVMFFVNEFIMLDKEILV